MLKTPKSLLLIGSVLCMANACNKSNVPTSSGAKPGAGFQISGQLSNAPAGTKVYLAELGEAQFVSRDTATVDDKGQFTFKGTVPEAGLYQVKLNDQNQALVALDNSTQLELKGDATRLTEGYSVKGSEDSEMLRQLGSVLSKGRESGQALEQRYNAAAAAGRADSMQAIEAQFMAAQTRNSATIKKLIRQRPTSVASAFVVNNLLNLEQEFPFADSMATLYKKAMPESRYTKALVARLDPLRATAEGVQAPEINLSAPDGKTVPLSSLRGKYVLLDFWASWCGPCRKENPNVVKAYQKFKGKGFEIYSVSLDQNRDKWLKAIKDDNLTWTHVSDLKGWESAAGKSYGITSIPMSLLLDPQGKIIAKNLRGPALEAKLASVLK
ncbi:TlpA disulfide reductase family protein [Hymenobacter sp. BT730]|uniref:TlpA disulfide reductase family protein n=1 Tax=Hymenobacter sp. BT730 TaxID=3063332 RepID=UPI0026DEBAB8|nr:TlpA disulfide reductase family protein [Hymenobacter sp. BT730]